MSQNYYEFFCPVKVIAGKAALEHLPYELTSLAARRPMIVTDKGVRSAKLLDANTIFHLNPSGRFTIGGPDGDAASALRHTCRSLLKGHHANRAQEIRELLAEARAALKFSDRRKAEGEASALLIQRVVAYPFLARRMIRLLILERWEKRWNDGQQTYFYIDTWAERASSYSPATVQMTQPLASCSVWR